MIGRPPSLAFRQLHLCSPGPPSEEAWARQPNVKAPDTEGIFTTGTRPLHSASATFCRPKHSTSP